MPKLITPLMTLLILICSALNGEQIHVITWNVESGDNDRDTIANQIADLQEFDVLGLSEVRKLNAAEYTMAAAIGESGIFNSVISETGNDDRLLIIYDESKYENLGKYELNGSVAGFPDLSLGNRVRAPLALKLKIQSSDLQFFFMVNHLIRSDAEERQYQATEIRKWAEAQSIPVICVGDFNFDYNLPSGPGNRAMMNFLTNNTFKWIQPSSLIKTQCSNRYNSILDFVFVSGAAKEWEAKSEILVRPNDCPDSNETSDHRPVTGMFEFTLEEKVFFIRGDVNRSGSINLSDAMFILFYLFVEIENPSCFKAADVNDDGRVDISDSLYSLSYMFLGTSRPITPFPVCGEDMTQDSLSCEQSGFDC